MPYVRTFDGVSNFAQESDGVWQLVNTGDSGPSNLVFIKTTNTPSGNVEVHIDSGASNYQTRTLDAVTNFASETDGTWGVVNDAPGSATAPDLYFIKTANTPSGNVEVHIDSGASNYQTRILDAVSNFAIETDGVWSMVYSGSSLPDLVFIKTANTPSGNVEVHLAQYELTLNVPLYPQLTDMWCWAASAQMVMGYEGTSASQCAQANSEFGMTDCCNSPTPSSCVQGGSPSPSFQSWGFSYDTTPYGTALPFDGLSNQFDLGLPVAFAWAWAGGGGHVMVAIGTNSTSGGQFVYINNPWPPDTGDQTWLTYAAYVQQPGSYTHQVDWYNTVPADGSAPATTPATTGGQMTNDTTGAPPARFGEARAAAEEGLRLLPVLAGAGGELELGEPLRVLYVRRDLLKRYEAGADPRPLLSDVGELLYPVTASGEVAAAVRARDAAAAKPAESFVVHVPSLYRIFIGHFDAAGGLVLSPVHDDAPRGFRRGVARPGGEILARLAPDAAQERDAFSAGSELGPLRV